MTDAHPLSKVPAVAIWPADVEARHQRVAAVEDALSRARWLGQHSRLDALQRLLAQELAELERAKQEVLNGECEHLPPPPAPRPGRSRRG